MLIGTGAISEADQKEEEPATIENDTKDTSQKNISAEDQQVQL